MPLSKTALNTFSSLGLQDVINNFDIQDSGNFAFPSVLFPFDRDSIAKLITKNADQMDYWTEQELVMKHISPILNSVDITGQSYNTFAQRPISAKVGDYEMSGYVDFLVAKGKYEPTQPYFFIHEFKKSLNPTGDPFGQLLGELLVAQVLNSEELVYGLVIIGRYWHFVVLKGKEFARLKPLDSFDIDDLQIIFDRLNGIKQYVEEKLQN
jgi:hypothetical protein